MVGLERLEGGKVKFGLNFGAEEFEAAVQKVYLKEHRKFFIEGFRKGKAPRKLIEARYGKGVFYEDALDLLLPDAYDKALDEYDVEPVSRPEVDIVKVGAEGAETEITVVIEPIATIDDYKGVTFIRPDTLVTDEDVENALASERKKNSRTMNVEGRQLALDDTVYIDFEGFENKVAFEGGKGENYELLLGSGDFIPGFEDQIAGHCVGQNFDVNVTFPEDYHAEDLAGKPVVFKVKVNRATYNELPEADDEFAQDVSEFDTIDEFKEDLRERIAKSKEASSKREIEDQVIAGLADRVDVEIPPEMVETEVRNMLADFQNRVRNMGMPFDAYLERIGETKEHLLREYHPTAHTNIRSRLALYAVGAAESIEVTEDDVEAEFKKLAERFHLIQNKMRETMTPHEMKNIRRDALATKALALAVEAAIEVAGELPKKNEEDEEI